MVVDARNSNTILSEIHGQSRTSRNNLIQRDGLWGWIVTLASFMAIAFTFGIIYSSGLFLSELVWISGESVAKVAWIFSIMNALQMLTGPLASALTNRFGHRAVIIAGSGLGCVGLVASSFTYSIEILFLTIGVLCGIAFGLVFTPSVVGIGPYFDKRRALATGIAVCGTGIGTFVMAPFTAWLLEIYSLRGTFLILGAVYLNCVLFGMFFQPVERIAPLITINKEQSNPLLNQSPQKRRILNSALLKSPTMILLCLSCLFQALGFVIPYMYLSAHAIQMGFSREASSFLLSVVGICSMFGRVMYGWLSDLPKVSILLVNNVSITVSGIIYAIFPFFTTYEWLIFYSIILGLIAVSSTTGTRPILIGYLMGAENVNDGFGLNQLCWGLGNLISIPLAGLFYDIFGDYKMSFYIAGSFILLSGFICYPIGWVNRWEKKRRLENCSPSTESP